MKSKENIVVGNCPICDRVMWKDIFIDRHHFYPKCMGGKETEYVHIVCHRKLHATFTEKELANDYYEPIRIRSHPEIDKFIKWIAKKEPDYYDRTDTHSRKRR